MKVRNYRTKHKRHIIATIAGLGIGVGVAAAVVVVNVLVINGITNSGYSRITSGDMEIALYQTYYQESTVNSDGYLVESSVNTSGSEDVSLGNEPLFDIDSAIPGTWAESGFLVDGSGSDVAFDCSLVITDLTDGNGNILFEDAGNTKSSAEYLAEQITITVTYSDVTTSFALSDYQSNTISFGTILAGDSTTFTIRAEFENDVNNNYAANSQVKFDIHLTAVQAVTD